MTSVSVHVTSVSVHVTSVCAHVTSVSEHVTSVCALVTSVCAHVTSVSEYVTIVSVHVNSVCAHVTSVRGLNYFNQNVSLPVSYQSFFANQSFAERYLKGIPETFQYLTFALQLLCVSSISAMEQEMEKQLKKKRK